MSIEGVMKSNIGKKIRWKNMSVEIIEVINCYDGDFYVFQKPNREMERISIFSDEGYRFSDVLAHTMKNVVLSADGDSVVYSVPADVADNLSLYCIEFADKWLHTSPDAKQYRIGSVVCYGEADFIEYLNKWIYPDQQSILVENLGFIENDNELPEKYKDCPRFNF